MRSSERGIHRLKGVLEYTWWKVAFEPGCQTMRQHSVGSHGQSPLSDQEIIETAAAVQAFL